MLALGSLTHFNIIAEMYLSLFFLVLTFLLICSLAFRTLGVKPGTLVLLVPVSLLLFGLRPWDVFLNGSVFLNSMTIFFTVLTFVLLERADREEGLSRTSVAALTCGVIATFSGSASGLIVWPIGMLQIWRMPFTDLFRSAKFRLWASFMFGCGAIYIGLLTSANRALPHTPGVSLLSQLANKLSVMPAYFFTLLGAPLCPDLKVMQICGVSVLLIYLSVAALFWLQRPYRKHPCGSRAAISIFLFGVAAVILITFGRSDRGYLEATATRYMQFSELMLIGAYLSICFSNFQTKALRPTLLLLFSGMSGVLYWLGYSAAPMNGMFWRNLQLKHAYILRTYKMQTDAQLSELQSNPFFVKLQAAKLENMKLNVFSRPHKDLDTIQTLAGEPSYCLDKINTLAPSQIPQIVSITRDSKNPIIISGWAFDNQSMQVAKRVALLVFDENNDAPPVIIPACSGLIYPGVAEGFKAKKLGDCGIFASFSPAILTPGRHKICIAVESTDGQHLQKSKPVMTVDVH